MLLLTLVLVLLVLTLSLQALEEKLGLKIPKMEEGQSWEEVSGA